MATSNSFRALEGHERLLTGRVLKDSSAAFRALLNHQHALKEQEKLFVKNHERPVATCSTHAAQIVEAVQKVADVGPALQKCSPALEDLDTRVGELDTYCSDITTKALNARAARLEAARERDAGFLNTSKELQSLQAKILSTVEDLLEQELEAYGTQLRQAATTLQPPAAVDASTQ
ncbi:uncharacterized protein MONBRDRAFT_31725 [Monosiga brevicollis MX1]|uniref:Biogenesis of lysosome-related organelles complex 1 subunit 5 n=1 Tax=Monosiga brevicollis TaxID=81824 RepID=A9UVC8_MONBE|nr:uncharacterized protein MONBRDRAFT_31725 [Monosiga brevicollis MX1]EDQ90871.1 predicted protein [Monosiga brevicollis MX1]|eukprot:XP_001744168.1 hypothetical protein [Monosiga brevicollis MX1]